MDLSKRYVGYSNASEAKKKRLEKRHAKKQERYAAAKERLDAKRERYADRMVGKGLMPDAESARSRFDELRNITTRSNTNVEQIMGDLYGNTETTEEKPLYDPAEATAGFRM